MAGIQRQPAVGKRRNPKTVGASTRSAASQMATPLYPARELHQRRGQNKPSTPTGVTNGTASKLAAIDVRLTHGIATTAAAAAAASRQPANEQKVLWSSTASASGAGGQQGHWNQKISPATGEADSHRHDRTASGSAASIAPRRQSHTMPRRPALTRQT